MTRDIKRPPRPSIPARDELAAAIAAVKADPSVQENWDRVEELADQQQKPEDVSRLFLSVLDKKLEPPLVSIIGQRAVRFQEAWYGEESSELPELLERVLKIDPGATWAFQRLTVAHTVAERWGELLALYDRAIASSDQTARRMQLLDEAAHVAKDFAAEPDRAIDYLTQLFSLDSSNASLAVSLERLLERQERWSDLIEVWRSRLAISSPEQARELRLRIAAYLLDKLNRVSEALGEVKSLAELAGDRSTAYALLERIIAAEAASLDQRREALSILKRHYLEQKREVDLVRVLEAMLAHVRGEERKAVLSELTDRLVTLGQDAKAMEHQGALLLLGPTVEAAGLLRKLAERARRFDRYAEYLVQAAAAAQDAAVAVDLLREAARVQEELLGDKNAAVEFYQRALGAKPAPEASLDVARRLSRLLEETGRDRERLEALGLLATLESESAARAAVLGQAAHLAERLGEKERAAQAWHARLAMNAADLEAIEALIVAYESGQQWKELIEALRKRVIAPVPATRRRQDLVRIARVYAEQIGDREKAIRVWREIGQNFGKDAESIAALIDLLSKVERWAELAEVLEEAAGHETARFADLQVQLGDAYRERLNRSEQAVDCYSKALQADPRHARARAGLLELLGNRQVHGAVVEALTAAFSASGEWQKKLEILEQRLAEAGGARQKVEILCEAAEAQEQRNQDNAAALNCWKRALALAPDDRHIEKEVHRLAELLSAWQVVVEAYRDTINNLEPGSVRVAELLFQQGAILEARLGDPQAALQAYAAAAAAAPDRVDIALAALTMCAVLGEWKKAARIVAALFQARGKVEPALFEVLESVAVKTSSFDALAGSMTEVLEDTAGMAPALARELYTKVALWHRDQRGDPAAAEAALSRAIARESGDAAALEMLADLQRRLSSKSLPQTLLQLADLSDKNLDFLCEAAEAAGAGGELELERSILQRLYGISVTLWRRGQEALGRRSTASCAAWSVERLVQRYLESGQPASGVKLLQEAAALPLGQPAASQQMRHKAAETAADTLRDARWAIEIYREILERDAGDLRAIQRLAELYRSENRLPDLLVVRQQELALNADPERRLELRLELNAIFGLLQERVDRVELLKTNLKERPGHMPSIEALTKILAGSERRAELAVVLREQAAVVEAGQEPQRAVELWRLDAEICEKDLGDVDAAIHAYQKYYQLEQSAAAAGSLARLYAGRGQHAVAAEWLERQMEAAPPPERENIALKLADAHLQAGAARQARAVLERALSQDGAARAVRGVLANMYRREQMWDPLARLLAKGAEHVDDATAKLEYLKEAVDIYFHKLAQPQLAVTSLQRAVELAPETSELSAMLADSLRAAGRMDEARQVLQRLVDGFGRKRGPERAQVHFMLAKLESDAGNLAACYEQLDMATKMDLSHVGALQMMGELARKQGDLERSERAYRGLLMLLRRQPPGESDALGPAQVLFELYGIAKELGREEQAQELMESALENAQQNQAESRRFQQALRRRGETDLLLKFLDARLKNPQSPPVEAEILATRADVLAELGRGAEALDALVRALSLDPDSDALHRATRELAVKSGQMQRYLDCLASLAESARNKKGKKGLRQAAQLTLRLGEIIETELKDLGRAAGLYAKVESSGELVEEAWLAMARVAGARGDRNEQRRVLRNVVEMEGDRVTPQTRADAFFQLAELELSQEDTRESGMEALSRALESAPLYQRAKQILTPAVESAPRNSRLLDLYRSVAHDSGDQQMMLDYFERRAKFKDCSLEEVRQGVDLAARLQEYGKAEKLLGRAVELAKAAKGEESRATWALIALSECRKREQDLPGAIAYLRKAAETAAEDEAVSLTCRIAELAAGPGGDLEVAAEAYLRLLERDRTDRGVWQPLLQVYRGLGDRARMKKLVDELLEALQESQERCDLRMQYADFLIETAHREKEAVAMLQAVLGEEPDHAQATAKLADIFERNGYHQELTDLLFRQFDRARDQQNLEMIARLGLRIGGLQERSNPEQALETYRAALEWVPKHAGLLRALLALMGPGADQSERVEIMQRLLAVETGEPAVALAEELVAVLEPLGDRERFQQALEQGYACASGSELIRARLESWYAELEMWQPMAEFCVREAERVSPSAEAVGRLKNAAAIYRERLGDVPKATAALRRALELVPGDLSLLGELVRNAAATGDQQAAIDDVTRLLDGHAEADSARVDLLRIRADLRQSIRQNQAAVADLEEAYKIAGAEVASTLIEALVALRDQAASSGEGELERSATFRLMQLLQEVEDWQGAGQTLLDWVERHPSDIEALRKLRAMDTAAERWEDVARTCERLIAVETGDALADAAVGLAEACERAGRYQMARAGLEQAFAALPDNQPIRSYLRRLYEQTGAWRELGEILRSEAAATADIANKIALLQKAGQLLLSAGDPGSALTALHDARQMAPGDDMTTALLVDAYTAVGRMDDAYQMLNAAIEAHKRRRSPELAVLQQRAARLAAASRDRESQLKWLSQALDTDQRNFEIASELAEAAMSMGKYDLAMKALRAITMVEESDPVVRAKAFLQQAKIAHVRDDVRRAQHWARKAKSLDPNLTEADEFLKQIG